jgi:hypothetical protein
MGGGGGQTEDSRAQRQSRGNPGYAVEGWGDHDLKSAISL